MKKERWVVAAKKADFYAIGAEFGIDPVIARLIRNRDVTGSDQIRDYLYGDVHDLPSPWLMKDMEKAVEILEEKISSGKRIRIIGDYDIDGVTSTYILLKSFRDLGAKADICIPDRVQDGYGLHRHLVERAYEDGIDTIVTCDNGISALEEIDLAKKLGMCVIVTDHHEIPYRETGEGKVYQIPQADAVVNPRQRDCPYPSKNICGAVVAWKLVRSLFEKRGMPEESWMDYLEFAAMATVGDVMDLKGENRTIVKAGLKKLSNTKNPGLQALIRANGLEGSPISAYHVGFVLGPCINASGRLDTARRSLDLLLASDEVSAARIAGDLKDLNESRKALTEIGRDQARKLVEETELGKDRVLVIFLPETHESLAGIIAGRIREEYHRPVFVLTRGEQRIKGSGRSIEAYSMYDELVKCADLLTSFGGHPMAAGISLEEENIEAFRRRLNENCTLREEDLTPRILIDVPMPISYITRRLVDQLSLLEPFGKGNDKPLFAQKNLRVTNLSIVGKNRNVARMQLSDGRATLDGVYFGDAEDFVRFVQERETVSLTYYPEVNVYNGVERLQLVIRNFS